MQYCRIGLKYLMCLMALLAADAFIKAAQPDCIGKSVSESNQLLSSANWNV